MNRRVLPASCWQRNRRKALPTRRRQHLVSGTVRLVRDSWSQSTRSNERGLSIKMFFAHFFFLSPRRRSRERTEVGIFTQRPSSPRPSPPSPGGGGGTSALRCHAA